MLQRPIQTNERGIRQVNGYLTNNGTLAIAGGQGFSAVRDNTGLVTVTLTNPSKSLIGFQATVLQATTATGHYAKVISASALGVVQFATYVADGTDGALADVNFSFQITVKDVSL
jgi:hypothetical protein